MKLNANFYPSRQAAIFSLAEMTPFLDFKKKKKTTKTEVGKTDGLNNGCINLNPRGRGINGSFTG
jgi:hypothetical protein